MFKKAKTWREYAQIFTKYKDYNEFQKLVQSEGASGVLLKCLGENLCFHWVGVKSAAAATQESLSESEAEWKKHHQEREG